MKSIYLPVLYIRHADDFKKKLIFFLHMGIYADIIIFVAGYGSVWLERTAGGREVAGSNPVTPIFYA